LLAPKAGLLERLTGLAFTHFGISRLRHPPDFSQLHCDYLQEFGDPQFRAKYFPFVREKKCQMLQAGMYLESCFGECRDVLLSLWSHRKS
jgi:hypothetical protein